MIATAGAPLSRLRPPPNIPANMPMRMRKAASMEKKLAIVMTATSRLATWESSCARTPSTSWGSSRRQSPSVTATAACFGLRPVAKAFGMSVGMMATRGLGRSAIAQSRSTIAWSCGASSGPTTLAPAAASAILSDV